VPSGVPRSDPDAAGRSRSIEQTRKFFRGNFTQSCPKAKRLFPTFAPPAGVKGSARAVWKAAAVATHTVPADPAHHTWDVRHPPVCRVESGDTILIQTRDVSDNQITLSSTTAALASLAARDRRRSYPLAGPVYVNGAAPGDTLAVEIVTLRPEAWGWTAFFPGRGLLPDDFTEPYLRIFDLRGGDAARMRDDIAIPIAPFFGTMGVCPAGAREQAVMPPGTFGGNMDIRQLTAGATVYLPVQVDGALFSCGDAHAAQGDGEVCITGIEASMRATLRLTVQKGRFLAAPQFAVPGPLVASRINAGGWYGTTGVGPDLYRAAQDAVRAMIAHLTAAYALSREDAYVLASLCVDLRISEIVDAGQYIVSALLPLAVLVPPA
jgi:acetamidase/formamidase